MNLNSNLVFDSQSKHIKELYFKNHSLLKNTSIKDMDGWKDIPKLAIITGRNGTGKSQLLEYIKNLVNNHNMNLAQINNKIKVIYKKKEESFGYNKFQPLKKINNAVEINLLEQESIKYVHRENNNLDQILKIFTNDSSDYKNSLDEVNQNLFSNPNDIDLKENIKKLISVLIIKPNISENLSSNFLKLIHTLITRKEAIKNYHNYIKNNFVEELNKLKNFYSIKYNSDESDFFERIHNESLISEYTDSKLRYRDVLPDFKNYDFEIELNGSNDLIIKKNYGSNIFKEITELSTGEQFILDLLSLKYEINDKLDLTNPNIILLDEPDKSLDPDYIGKFFNIIYNDLVIKNKIQVILITHKTDTIRLASFYQNNDIGIYSLKRRENQVRLEKCSPQIAIFRLSFNRESDNVKIRIYVESLDDSEFYTLYYYYFYKLCQEIRESNNTEVKSLLGKRLISRRYVFDFYSCSAQRTSGGGCEKVMSSVLYSVQRDINTERFKRLRTYIKFDKNLTNPFGLIDSDIDFTENDPNKGCKMVREKNLTNRIIVLQRHSLENYFFDPILFFLNQTRRKTFIQTYTNPSNQKLIQIMNDILDNVTTIVSALNNNNLDLTMIKYFKEILEQILKDPDLLKKVYSILDHKRPQQESRNKNLKKANNKTYINNADLNDLITDLNNGNPINTENGKLNFMINLTEKRKYIFKNDYANFKYVEVNYPLIFLYLRGHDIENQIMYMLDKEINELRLKNENEKRSRTRKDYDDLKRTSGQIEMIGRFKEKQKREIFDDLPTEKYFLPYELVEDFSKLNEWIRNQANSILKPRN